MIARVFFLGLFLLLAGCAANHSITTVDDEREANEIVVFLASKGIDAQKVQAVSAGAVAATSASTSFDIMVSAEQMNEAMSLLNRYGLPRRKDQNLLQLFVPSGFMTSPLQETIRYQAGLAQQLCNTIRKIDGIIDADVQLAFPPTEPTPGTPPTKVTAAVYVKHQGVLEDPNSHIETKIKRLLAGSVNGLDFDNVSVISDRARFADIALETDPEMVGNKNYQQTYASIWSIVMTKSSLTRFRFLFFSLITLLLLFAAALGWLIYLFYPQIFLKLKGKETPPPG